MASNTSLASLVITVETGLSDEEGPVEPSHLGEKSWELRRQSPASSENQPCATDPVGLQMPVGQNGPGPGPGSGGHSCVYCCVERRWGPREGWASFWWRWACVTEGSKLMSTLPALAQPFRAPRTDEESSEDGLMLRMVLCLWTVGSNRVFPHLLWLVPGFSRTSRHPESADWDAWFRCFTENSAIVKRTLGLQHCRLNSTSSPLYLFFVNSWSFRGWLFYLVWLLLSEAILDCLKLLST